MAGVGLEAGDLAGERLECSLTANRLIFLGLDRYIVPRICKQATRLRRRWLILAYLAGGLGC